MYIIIWDLKYKKKKIIENNAIAPANHHNNLYSDSLLAPVDILVVDSKSRITFTHKLKSFFSVNPGDKIIVYHNRQDKNLTFKVQHNDSFIVDTWTLAFNKDSKNDSVISRKTDEKKDNGVNKSKKQDKKDLHQAPILIVDNDKDVVETFEDILKDEGYTNIKTFIDSKEVLKYFNDIDKFKLAVLDIRMPDINGIQLYSILKILNPRIKVLFMTALDAVNELTSIMYDIKQEDLMRKPTDINQFVERVNNKISASSIIID